MALALTSGSELRPARSRLRRVRVGCGTRVCPGWRGSAAERRGRQGWAGLGQVPGGQGRRWRGRPGRGSPWPAQGPPAAQVRPRRCGAQRSPAEHPRSAPGGGALVFPLLVRCSPGGSGRLEGRPCPPQHFAQGGRLWTGRGSQQGSAHSPPPPTSSASRESSQPSKTTMGKAGNYVSRG